MFINISNFIVLTNRSKRDGKVFNTLAKNLVPGDVVEVSTGDRIPADIRLVEVSNSLSHNSFSTSIP